VIGSERHGLDLTALAECEASVTIPQLGVTESLNVAVASGIILAEFKRQEALSLLESDAIQEETLDSSACSTK